MQVIMVTTMFSGEEFQNIPEDTPEMAGFMFKHFNLFIYSFFVLTIFTFISSIALLKRKNWARISFVVILSIGILMQLGGFVMQFFMFSDLPVDEADKQFRQMATMIRWVNGVISIAMIVLFTWLIKRLTSQPIISEFTLTQPRNSDALDSVGS